MDFPIFLWFSFSFPMDFLWKLSDSRLWCLALQQADDISQRPGGDDFAAGRDLLYGGVQAMKPRDAANGLRIGAYICIVYIYIYIHIYIYMYTYTLRILRVLAGRVGY